MCKNMSVGFVQTAATNRQLHRTNGDVMSTMWPLLRNTERVHFSDRRFFVLEWMSDVLHPLLCLFLQMRRSRRSLAMHFLLELHVFGHLVGQWWTMRR